ncbi:TIGR03086 family metal-binding protein [Phytohabitans sp. LJ34]|uniref:TIGR03086 family metal-binding protein n=1 Tax=Phytohabitans sp. LJ34 TaxID=3452217 RepID=UPI003F8CB629
MRDALEKAITETSAVLRGVEPDQLGLPTPCRDWDVRTLANHLLQVATALGLAGRGEPIPDGVWGRELIADGWADRFGSLAVPATTSDWAGAAPVIAAMLASDVVLHGWDLARATGQEYRCDPAAAEVAHRFVAETGEQGRRMGIYAEPVPVAADAPVLDRALGLSGRDPGWVPAAAG